MEPNKDFKELLALFNANHVEFVIVGAYALAFHGAPRFTGDLDLLVASDPPNAERILRALHAFGFGGLELVMTSALPYGRGTGARECSGTASIAATA